MPDVLTLNPRTKDLTGQTFERLTVIAFAGYRNRKAWWTCRCICGAMKEGPGYNLKNGDLQSCGCLHKERVGKMRRVYGWRRIPGYSLWRSMLRRCYATNTNSWKNYGGRGITVCERWRLSLLDFLEDMGPRPGPEYTIERRNNNLGYFPENTYWATKHQQLRNTRRTVLLTYNNKTQCRKDWALEYGIPLTTLTYRLQKGSSLEEALTMPRYASYQRVKPPQTSFY